MITIKAEQEHYCLVTDGGNWTVIERRAGKYHPLGDCACPGVALEDPQAAFFFAAGRRFTEPAARHILTEVATGWRHLAEQIR